MGPEPDPNPDEPVVEVEDLEAPADTTGDVAGGAGPCFAPTFGPPAR